MLGGLIYAFLTISLRANQNVTGLALTTFGKGMANFFGVFILDGASYSAAPVANKAFAAKIPVLSGLGTVGRSSSLTAFWCTPPSCWRWPCTGSSPAPARV